MRKEETILNKVNRGYPLPIWLTSHNNPLLPEQIRTELNKPERKGFFFIQLVIKGSIEHKLDWKTVTTSEGQILFITPELIHTLPSFNCSAEFYKISFESEILKYFPTIFNFFINPFNSNIISLSKGSKERVELLFKLLHNAMEDKEVSTDVVLSYLHSLLAECNSAYFKNAENSKIAIDDLDLFIRFKKHIEDKFQEQPSIEQIASALSVNTNALYQTVKSRTGISPKEFLTERLILEAKRKLYFTDTSIKELAWLLGYNDPNYFSKLFKRLVGKSIAEYRIEVRQNPISQS